ncbi:hypothetical protein Vadar_007283 [Vaccinium darrowii]|uniref:Uncharacterized protein n=1 Tax=Vaccinium darrowii TaxID=229202 RepID=A0ACB7XXG2_9ERIC|nr:hypothetical protein Vadar_007283 [Vaccinium darrowii]
MARSMPTMLGLDLGDLAWEFTQIDEVERQLEMLNSPSYYESTDSQRPLWRWRPPASPTPPPPCPAPPPAAAYSKLPDYFLVKEEVKKVLSKGKAAGVLRLVFHDAGTFEIEENAVSWADMIAVAGAEAVSVCGGPNIPVQLGRIDSMVPDPKGKLPQESLDASSLKQCFQRKGFSTQELVALSGAHTLGSKGFGNPTVFDNSYFKILLEKPWSSSAGMSSMVGLPTDRALVEDDECLRWISMYANDQDLFFQDFRNVYIKLVNTGATWKPAL